MLRKFLSALLVAALFAVPAVGFGQQAGGIPANVVRDGPGTTTANEVAVSSSRAHTIGYATTLPASAMPAVSGDVTIPAGTTTATVSKVSGVAGTPTTITVQNATSGSITVSPPTGALGTVNLTWPDASGTLLYGGGPLGTPSSGVATNLTGTAAGLSIGGTAANLSGTPALPNGTTATTQTTGDNSTKLATDAFVLANAASAGVSSAAAGNGITITGTGSGPYTGAVTISTSPAPNRTAASPTVASTDMGGQINVSSGTVTIPAIGSGVFGNGQSLVLVNTSGSTEPVTSTPTINNCTSPIPVGGTWMLLSNGTSLDCLQTVSLSNANATALAVLLDTTAITVSGCTPSASVLEPLTGTITQPATACTTATFTFAVTAPHGWICSLQDETLTNAGTHIPAAGEASSTTTSCTVPISTAMQNASDVLTIKGTPR